MAPSSIITDRTRPMRTCSESTMASTGSPTSEISNASSSTDMKSRFMARIRSRSPSDARKSTTTSPLEDRRLTFRADSSLSNHSTSSTSSFRPKQYKRSSSTTMDVGRHSNDWLFGGFSFTGAIGKILSDERK